MLEIGFSGVRISPPPELSGHQLLREREEGRYELRVELRAGAPLHLVERDVEGQRSAVRLVVRHRVVDVGEHEDACGKRDALAARFATRTAAIYARHGITNVGYWIPQESDPELGISAQNTFIYIRGYPSKAERDKRLNAAHDDPEFAEVVTKQEANPATKLIVKAHNIDMAPNGTYTAITITK